MDKGSNIIKYIFIVFVIVLICITGYILINNRKEKLSAAELDQTSKVSNIQTDLRLAIAGFDTMNPILSKNRNVQEISKIIYEPLINLNQYYEKEYCLATEVAKTDDLTYVVKVNDKATWSDGTKVTANDVKFTVDMIKADGLSSIYEENVKAISGLECIDENTVQISLAYEVPYFEYNLTFPILSSAYYQDEDFVNTAKNEMPIGTGKFKIVEVVDNKIKLARNDIYWNKEKLPMVKEVVITKYQTIGEVYNAFKSGDIDLYIVKANNVEQYIGTIGYNKVEYKSRDYDFLVLNNTNEALSNPVVRKALSLVIDRSTLVASTLGQGYTPSNFSLDMGNFLYTEDLNFAANTEEAHQLLIADGWEYKSNVWQKNVEGKLQKLNFNLLVDSSNENRVKVAEAIKTQYENFGVHFNILYLSYENYINSLNNKSYDVILAGVTMGFSPSVELFFGENNLANYYNEEAMNILNETKNTSDRGVLYNKYERLFNIYLEEAPYIGLYRNTESIIMNQGLVGNIIPNTFNIFYNIEKWYRQ